MTTTPAALHACRTEVAAQIQAYRDLVGAASKASGMSLARIDAALSVFEPAFFNNLLVTVATRFAEAPARGPAGTEMRLLADALLHRGGVLAADAALPYDPDAAVLRLDVGERVALNAEDVEALCTAFLREVEAQLPA